MIVVYNNDEQKVITVKINDGNFYKALNSGGDLSPFYVTLQPSEVKVFNLDAPEGVIPYVKKWKEVVMISYIDPHCLAQFGRWPLPLGDA